MTTAGHRCDGFFGTGGAEMKRKKLFLAIGIVAAVICCGALMRWAFIQVFFAEPAVMETAVSPDGKYIAYAYESNGGATSGWTYHVSVLKAGQKLHKGNGIYT